MASRLGPIDVSCDAPPYYIVRACKRLGMKMPEDVRWCRMSHYLNSSVGGVWKALLGLSHSGEKTCICKRNLPMLERCTFTLASGKQASYFIGQCNGCRTIYWEEV